MDAELSSLRLKLGSLEAALRGREKEVERLGRAMEGERGEREVEAGKAAARAEEGLAKAEAALAQTRVSRARGCDPRAAMTGVSAVVSAGRGSWWVDGCRSRFGWEWDYCLLRAQV